MDKELFDELLANTKAAAEITRLQAERDECVNDALKSQHNFAAAEGYHKALVKLQAREARLRAALEAAQRYINQLTTALYAETESCGMDNHDAVNDTYAEWKRRKQALKGHDDERA